ncbi:MAG: hypothetical protein ABH842_00115 [Candidatus Micrarchaeota archaeon]
MKKFVFGILVIFLFFGCIIPSDEQPLEIQPQPVCKTVIKQHTFTRVDCQNISTTSNICSERPMNYSILSITKSNLCTAGNCAGLPLYDCMDCGAAMTRCIMTVKNNEATQSGVIEMGAEFTFPSGAFIKNPVSKTLKAGENTTFDFYQSYSLSTQFSTPECTLSVVEEPLIEECVDITTYDSICNPVTVTEPVETIVCS